MVAATIRREHHGRPTIALARRRRPQGGNVSAPRHVLRAPGGRGPAVRPRVAGIRSRPTTTGLARRRRAGHAQFIDHHLGTWSWARTPGIREALWERMFRSPSTGPQGMAIEAISAIDIAIWDILARRPGSRVQALGRTRTASVYASRLYATRPDAGRGDAGVPGPSRDGRAAVRLRTAAEAAPQRSWCDRGGFGARCGPGGTPTWAGTSATRSG
jgi:hypothetical protein